MKVPARPWALSHSTTAFADALSLYVSHVPASVYPPSAPAVVR